MLTPRKLHPFLEGMDKKTAAEKTILFGHLQHALIRHHKKKVGF